jgi:signal transduction histidine kinase
MGLVALAGVGAVGLGMGPAGTAAAVLGAGAIGAGVLYGVLSRRARALDRLERAAAELLTAGVAGSRAPDLGPLGDMPEELRPLARSVAELGERVRGQLKEVAKKSRNLEALIDAMDEPLLVTGEEDRVLLCSRSAERILDVEAGALVGRPIHELFTQAEVLQAHGAAKAGTTRRGRVRLMTALGQRTFQVSAAPLPAAWGRGVFGAVLALRDVTELDQAVQVKTDFVANASHELRTPVAAIRSAAETLESAADDPAMSARLRGMIVSHAQRLEEMLRDLLDLSRLESPDAPVTVEPVDLGDLERTLRHLSEHACAERGLSLSFEFEEELRGLRTDRKLLTLILRNLVENATKFAHDGTTIRVLGSVIEEEVPRGGARGVRAAERPAGKGVVRFEVIDRGVGIPLAQQERVFERYYQVDPSRTATGPAWRRGTGLGLAIVKHAAKALGGVARLSSVWGQGTTVFVEFPAELAPVASEGAAKQAG